MNNPNWGWMATEQEKKPTPKDPKGYLAKSQEYTRWRQQPKFKNWAPVDYAFLTRFPNNFHEIRREFELHWAVKRLTR